MTTLSAFLKLLYNARFRGNALEVCMSRIRIGMMGLGQIGRQIFRLALGDERFDVVAVSDIGQPEILRHLLDKDMGRSGEVRLENNSLVSAGSRARMLSGEKPGEIPWDVFEVDCVIDATGRFRSRGDLAPHLDNGAARVVTSMLPVDEIDRVVLFGVNEEEMAREDRIVSAGSASTTATALALKILSDRYAIEHATMTSVHAYTSDQSLQDYAGADYRRSRSGARNIIPNDTPALGWIQRLMPQLQGRMTAYALNVPVQTGSMLDITVSLADGKPDIDEVRELFRNAAKARPELIETTDDPIVSSDVRDCGKSLLVDLKGCMPAGARMLKILAWHESLGHASRILDAIGAYSKIDANSAREAA